MFENDHSFASEAMWLASTALFCVGVYTTTRFALRKYSELKANRQLKKSEESA